MRSALTERVRARKRFGQHFLADRTVATRIAESVEVGPGRVLVEIGPGTGALTAALLAMHDRVVGVEIDRDLIAVLRRRFPVRQLRIVEGDVLRLDLGALLQEEDAEQAVVVGNLPYNITAPVLFGLVEQHRRVERATLMVQREVARRLTAKPGNREYGQITVLLSMYASVEYLFGVEPAAFRPVPKVHSAVIRCVFAAGPRCSVLDEQVFRRVVRMAFGQRRKMLRNSLQGMLPGRDRGALVGVLRQAAVDPETRPESLAWQEFAALSDAFVRHGEERGHPQDEVDA